MDAHLLLMHIWALTQHYADFALQVRVIKGIPAGDPLPREAITREVTAFILRGCGLQAPN
jgi:TetR/AcrR family transcriptional regulator